MCRCWTEVVRFIKIGTWLIESKTYVNQVDTGSPRLEYPRSNGLVT